MISQVKVGELAKLTNLSVSAVSIFLKTLDDTLVTRDGKRMVGISPEAAELFLRRYNPSFFRPAVILIANLCGGG